ncbi:MAG: hypothetical protein ACFFD2_07080 [Promethearchaeota archaeon]
MNLYLKQLIIQCFEPITLTLDIQSNLSNSSSKYGIEYLNTIIVNNINLEKIYTPVEHIKFNNNLITGIKWPLVKDMRGKIVLLLTGNSTTR